MAIPFVESPHMTHTDGRPIDWLVIHTMEIPERIGAAEACARWFQHPVSEVSAHYCVDAESVIQCVREEDIAWHARGGNARSIGVELAGYAKQSADEWADEYSSAVLERAAALAAEICSRHEVPVRWLRAAGLRAGKRGITGHADVSKAFRKGDHWDPGPAFPIDRFLELVRQAGPLETLRSGRSGVPGQEPQSPRR